MAGGSARSRVRGGEGEGVLGHLRTEGGIEAGGETGRGLHRLGPAFRLAELRDRRRDDISVPGVEALPFQGEQAMTLQVAKDPVVAEDVEAVAGPLEGPARLVPPVGAPAHVGGDELLA